MAATTIPGGHSPSQLVSAFLQTIEHGIIPLTAIGVAGGNKVFGAAILRKDDLSIVIAATNQETQSPLFVSPTHSSSPTYRKQDSWLTTSAWGDKLYTAILRYSPSGPTEGKGLYLLCDP
jgi:hypothetical protein